MSARPRVALIGVGAMGAQHARVLAASDRCDLAVVIEPVEQAGRAVAASRDARWLPEVDLRGVDAVVIAAPTEHHRGLALQVIDLGLPVLVEKPVCASLTQTEVVLGRGRERGVPVLCGLVERYNPAVIAALRMVGEPLWVRTERHSPYASRVRTGVAWDLLIHDVDLAINLFRGEEPASVDSRLGYFHPASEQGAEDVAEALLGFGTGRVASLSASRLGQRKVRALAVQELDRVVEADLLRRTVTVYRHTSVELTEPDGLREQTVMETFDVPGPEPLAAQLDRFLDLVAGLGDPQAELDSVLPVHRVVERIVSCRECLDGYG